MSMDDLPAPCLAIAPPGAWLPARYCPPAGFQKPARAVCQGGVYGQIAAAVFSFTIYFAFVARAFAFVARAIVFVARAIVFVARAIAFVARAFVFVTGAIVFVTIAIVFVARGIVFVARAIAFVARGIGVGEW